MRALAIASVVFLLAGCTQNSPGDGTPTGDYGSCPSWVKGLSGYKIRDDGAMTYLPENAATYYMPGGGFERWDLRAFNQTDPGVGLGSGLLTFQDHPLDQMVFDFRPDSGVSLANTSRLLYIQDGEMHLEFFADEGGYPGELLFAYDQTKGPSSAQDKWVFRSDPVKNYSFYNITLRLDLAHADEDPNPRGVFVHWIMAEVDLDRNPDTTTMEAIRYAPELWYRTCGGDGTRY